MWHGDTSMPAFWIANIIIKYNFHWSVGIAVGFGAFSLMLIHLISHYRYLWDWTRLNVQTHEAKKVADARNHTIRPRRWTFVNFIVCHLITHSSASIAETKSQKQINDENDDERKIYSLFLHISISPISIGIACRVRLLRKPLITHK